MKLKHHSKLRAPLGALAAWPPLWVSSSPLAGSAPPVGLEGGILTKVEDLSAKALRLTVDFQGSEYQGILQSRDAKFVAQLYHTLEPRCLGMSIRAVGDLELKF